VRGAVRLPARARRGRGAADADAIAALKALLPGDGSAAWTDRFLAPPLTAGPAMAGACRGVGARAGPDVDFWTEAALFAAGDGAGLPAVVLGPGDIAQAHAADEFVRWRSCLVRRGVRDRVIATARAIGGVIRRGFVGWCWKGVRRMLREIVLNLLHNLGGRAEVDRYLREYTGAGAYAVVKVGGGLIADDLDELASARWSSCTTWG
jgi:hypothetical protein